MRRAREEGAGDGVGKPTDAGNGSRSGKAVAYDEVGFGTGGEEHGDRLRRVLAVRVENDDRELAFRRIESAEPLDDRMTLPAMSSVDDLGSYASGDAFQLDTLWGRHSVIDDEQLIDLSSDPPQELLRRRRPVARHEGYNPLDARADGHQPPVGCAGTVNL